MEIRTLLFYAALISTPLSSHALLWTTSTSCKAAAEAAAAQGDHHVVITLEGLMTGFNGFAANYGRRIVSSAGKNAPVMHYSHVQPSSAARCAATWKAIHGEQLSVTVIGHSLGGGAAVQAIEMMGQQGIRVQDLITFDGRTGPEVVCGDYGGPKFRRPANVALVTNFYQCGAGFPGRTFIEDGQVRNIRMNAGVGAHVLLPTSAYAQQIGADLMARRIPSYSTPTEVARRVPAISPPRRTASYSESTRPTSRPARRTVLSYQPHKANKPAKCERMGRWVPCTYAQASEESYPSGGTR